jgi:hypothetical protein
MGKERPHSCPKEKAGAPFPPPHEGWASDSCHAFPGGATRGIRQEAVGQQGQACCVPTLCADAGRLAALGLPALAGVHYRKSRGEGLAVLSAPAFFANERMTKRLRQNPAARARRPGAWALSLFLSGLQFLGLAHLGLERHGVCWEHGTLTELAASKSSAPEVAPVGLRPGLYARYASAALEDEGHHHCPVQASRQNWGAPPAGAVLVLSVDVAQGASALGTSVPRADGGLLARAPKQSPPLAA